MNKLTKVISIVSALLITSTTGLSASAANVDIIKSKANNNTGVVAMPYNGETTTLDVNEELPSSYSSKDLGYVTPIRQQGNAQICWAYGGLSSLESTLVKDGAISNTSDSWLSASHVDAWGTPRKDGSGWQREYYKGAGYPYITLGYLTSWNGGVSEKEFPYTNPLQLFDINKKYNVENTVTGVMYLDATDHNTIKKAIKDYGAVTTHYNQKSLFEADNMHTYCPIKVSSAYIYGHCVSVVGWDDNYEKDNFAINIDGKSYIPKKNGAWLCKNSWGNYNKMDGYFWISYEDYYIYSDVFGPSYVFTDHMKKKDSDTIHQVETFGKTYEFDYLNEVDDPEDPTYVNPFISKDNTYINVFNIENSNEYLNKVMFESESIGADYTIYYIPIENNGTPSSNKSTWKTLKAGKVPYSGYYTVDVEPQYINKGKIGIGVEIDTTSNNDYNGIGVSEWLENKNERIFNTEAKRGQSYLYTENNIFSKVSGLNKSKMNDVMDFYKYINDDTEGGNFVIKAITYKVGTIIGDADMNGTVDIKDATLIQKYTIHSETLSSEGMVNADINQDGIVNVKDVTKLQRMIAKSSGDNQ